MVLLGFLESCKYLYSLMPLSQELDYNVLNSKSRQRSGDEVLIEFQDVYKSFGTKPILKGASFKIYRGEAVGIIGASGTGKSTTLRLAAGLLAPDKVLLNTSIQNSFACRLRV